jgi:predicted transcriptional regulator
MKSATIPPLRVTPKLRQDAQSVLKEGETLSSFAEEALRKQIENRKFQQEFIKRGLAARDKAKTTGNYVSKDEVMVSLRSILKKAKQNS